VGGRLGPDGSFEIPIRSTVNRQPSPGRPVTVARRPPVTVSLIDPLPTAVTGGYRESQLAGAFGERRASLSCFQFGAYSNTSSYLACASLIKGRKLAELPCRSVVGSPRQKIVRVKRQHSQTGKHHHEEHSDVGEKEKGEPIVTLE
jgi:hypothetical protein